MRFVSADELRDVLPMTAAIDALERAFRDEDPDAAAPMRSTLETASGKLLSMPATGARGTGVKLVTLTDENPSAGLPFIQAAYVLFSAGSQTPVAVIDGTALTTLRTAAVSGLATRWLARSGAGRVVIVGAGAQAEAHIDSMRAVRDISDLAIVSRTQERAHALAERAGARVGTVADLKSADIVCTCTTSPTPVVHGRDLAPGAHVNAVGAYTPDTRELDTDAVLGARVVVETRSVSFAESGALCLPVQEGAFDEGHVVADLGEMVRGAAVRRDDTDRTVFLSVGMAFEDLVVAGAAVEALG